MVWLLFCPCEEYLGVTAGDPARLWYRLLPLLSSMEPAPKRARVGHERTSFVFQCTTPQAVFLSREKPSVRHALVRLSPFPPTCFGTVLYSCSFACVGIEARAHRSVLAYAPQRRVIAGRGQSAGSWRRLGEHCQRNNNKNKHRLNISTFHIVARGTLERPDLWELCSEQKGQIIPVRP